MGSDDLQGLVEISTDSLSCSISTHSAELEPKIQNWEVYTETGPMSESQQRQ